MKKFLLHVFLVFGLLSRAVSFAQIDAQDDTFAVVYGATEVTAGNVLYNDYLNQHLALDTEVTIAQVSSSNPGISLSGFNIVVAGGTPKGTYTLTYSICSVANNLLCDTATVTVNTKLLANPDYFFSSCFSPFIGNVLGSGSNLDYVDTLNNVPAILETYYTQPGNVIHPADVTLNVISGYPGIDILSNGDVLVFQQLPPGSYILTYELHEIAHPGNISVSYVQINIFPPQLFVGDDYFPAVDNALGGLAGNVLENDFLECSGQLNGSNAVVTVSNIPQGITINPDGTVMVAPGTAPGTYAVNYTVCELIYNSCADAHAFVTVTGISGLVANYDDFSAPNYPGTATASVLSNDTLHDNPFTPTQVTLTPMNNPVGFTLNTNGTIAIAPTVPEGTYMVPYQICDAANASDCYVNYAYVVVLKNRILGTVRYDYDANGCSETDPSLLDIGVKNVNGTTTSFSTTKRYDWQYYLIGDSGTNTVSLTDIPSYFTVTPATQVLNLSTPGTVTAPDFCLSANSNVDDLEVVLIPLFNIVPGLPTYYNIWFKNNGSTILSGQINLQYDSTKMSFLSSNPGPDNILPNSLVFNYSFLHPFESRLITNVKWQAATPPTVDSGQLVPFSAGITPVASDYTPANNTNQVIQTVVNSQDPNDIVVHEGASITLAKAQQDYLHYTIRFQNVGTSDAINIKILNDLDPKLDWSTFKLVSSSDVCRVKNTNNHNEFLFENINLPGASNEPLSHGYVSFKVKPVGSIAVGDIIPNAAQIYFDYNAPISTNTVNTTIINNLGVDTFDNEDFDYFPNPTTSTVTFKTKAMAIDQLEITDILGKTLISKTVQATEAVIDLSTLNSGIYFAKLTSGKKERTVKLVRK